jgi:hypothetical protein
MPLKTRDLRVVSIRPLLPPAILLEELPLSEQGARHVARAREEVARILAFQDDRLVVVVGPCSIHDPAAARDYAGRLAGLADELYQGASGPWAGPSAEGTAISMGRALPDRVRERPFGRQRPFVLPTLSSSARLP